MLELENVRIGQCKAALKLWLVLSNQGGQTFLKCTHDELP